MLRGNVAMAAVVASMAETLCLAWERDAWHGERELSLWIGSSSRSEPSASVPGQEIHGSVRRNCTRADHGTRMIGRRSGRRCRDRRDDDTAAVDPSCGEASSRRRRARWLGNLSRDGSKLAVRGSSRPVRSPGCCPGQGTIMLEFFWIGTAQPTMLS